MYSCTLLNSTSGSIHDITVLACAAQSWGAVDIPAQAVEKSEQPEAIYSCNDGANEALADARRTQPEVFSLLIQITVMLCCVLHVELWRQLEPFACYPLPQSFVTHTTLHLHAWESYKKMHIPICCHSEKIERQLPTATPEVVPGKPPCMLHHGLPPSRDRSTKLDPCITRCI